MRMDCAAALARLELSGTPTAQEVKRAYVRQVRLHPPERDPEAFKAVRAAYELLRGGVRIAPELKPPEGDEVEYCMMQARRAQAQEDYRAACSAYALALEHARDDAWLLRELAWCQLRAGNDRKAVKTAEKLSRLLPDSADACEIMAMACYQTGWHRKALPLFRKARAMGAAELEFLGSYLACARDCDAIDERREVEWDILRRRRQDGDSLPLLIYAAYDLSELARDASELLAVAEAYHTALTRLMPALWEEALLSPVQTMLEQEEADGAVLAAVERLFALMECRLPPEAADALSECRDLAALTVMERDADFADPIWMELGRLLVMTEFQDEQTRQFVLLDTLLCALMRPDWRDRLALLSRRHPRLYAAGAEYFDRLFGDNPDWQITRWKATYAQMFPNFNGGRFYKRFPEERPHQPRQTVQRAVPNRARPGRNDPCPCGSGKKFKKCCIGKGIYD